MVFCDFRREYLPVESDEVNNFVKFLDDERQRRTNATISGIFYSNAKGSAKRMMGMVMKSVCTALIHGFVVKGMGG